ncbi:terminase large subunit [Sphingobium sp. C100]|jgi:phage terminase large subunit-like protein|uniref:terminase large subunit n=1 Tax=Sphingobium sp. C100 TaxID=1207055 RepID=UPI00041181FC|nr:terminase large subunit [Sphingobium sp. C100]
MGQPAAALTWNFACPDWAERLKAGRSLLPPLPLNDNEADRAVAIFNNLRLPDVPGQPLMEDAAGEWGRDIVRAIFGSMVDGERQVREVMALVPKKNAKTTNGAAIGVTALLMNERPRAEFVLVGPTQEIADTAFQQASGMIDADPYLKQRFHVADHRKAIYDRVLKATLKIKTFDMKVATGSKPVMVLIDELHLMGSISYAARVIGQLRGGMIANPEAFLVIITTQSDEAPAGVFKTELDYARGVRDGRIANARMLPLLYEFPEAMQTDPAKPWQDPRHWYMVLPNLGRSITVARLIEEYQAAVDKGPEEERRWASQHLNIQIGLALHTDRWRGADYWEEAADPRLRDLDYLLDQCEVAVVGVDGGGLDDLYGLCVAGREKGTKRWLYWFRGWVYREVLDLRHEIAPRLLDFERDQDLVIIGHNGGPPLDDDDDAEAPPTELLGDEQDVREIVDIIGRVKDRGLLPDKGAIGLDPEGVGALVDALAEIGLVHPQVVGVTQGYRLASAVWSLERKLKHRMAAHSGAPLINWCVGNAKAEQRGNAVIITKQAAGKAKIDPFMAGLNATKLLEANPEAKPPSVYQRRGVLRVGMAR